MKKTLSLTLAGLAGVAWLAAGCAGQQSPASASAPASARRAVTNPSTEAVAVPVTTPMVATPASVAQPALKVVRVDSEETAGENGNSANAVDGDPNTLWHTQWQDAAPECPHEIVIELAATSTLKGFTYLPRQDDRLHGMIKGYEFYISNDGQDFGQPVAKGEFDDG